jgi:AhpD family alkylhydroperoxidase
MTARGMHHPIIGRGRLGKTAGLVRRVPDYWAIYGRHRLDPVFREEIMLAVSGADSSRQCSFAHREWARGAGISEADLAALEALDFEALSERTWTAIEWAQAYARSDLASAPAGIEARFRQQFSARERADIELACRTMHWLNETSNTVDALGSRVRRKPVPGSTLLSEVIASVIYAVAVPVLVIMFSFMQRRNPLKILGSMNPFFHEFEARGPQTISGPGSAYRPGATVSRD